MNSVKLMEYVNNPGKIFVIYKGIEKEVPVMVWTRTGEATKGFVSNIELRSLKEQGLGYEHQPDTE